MTTSYYFAVFYKKAGVGTAPSSTPTLTVRDVTNGSTVVSAQNMTAVTALTGFYDYTYSGADGLQLLGKAITSDLTMDESEIGCAPIINKLVFTNLNATVSSRSTLGSGSISWTILVNDGVNPIDGVDVWITTDSAGTSVIARGETDDTGLITFLLDAGTYYAWKQLAGYTFTNPSTITVV